MVDFRVMRKVASLFVCLLAACGGGKSTSPVGTPEPALPLEDAGVVEDAGAPSIADAAVRDAAPALSPEELAVLITAESVGPFRIGMKTKEAREVRKYKVVEIKKRVEEEMEKVLTAVDGENPLLEFGTKSHKLSSVTVLDRRFHTAKGIALGTKASLVEAAYGTPTGQYTLEGETCFFFANESRMHFCFKAGPKGWDAFAKKGKLLTTLIVSEK